ncbi:glucarate dehydratase [Hydrogenophaga crassostreae]|uniref:glucarate dehydratase n=1 Tax=Hydrogenophaga crassostreae TaxID=1763535 RepID=A0A162VMV9_9BURK|nr:enolase C-terminal domain-like protein [Hydrogenophaga crassostreae]AOW15199.1 glucarate dehydratase [Hydrogenophaga crassostreae]OAD39286.1 glucarate dehydratase [Hydrogenophaga crassostreae]
MKIIEMRVTPIAIGDPPLLNAAGLHAPFALRTIVELVTDDGRVGLGEIPGGKVTLQMLRDAIPDLIGCDPFQLNQIKQTLINHFGDGGTSEFKNTRPWETARINHVYSAIEVACFDLMGQAVGRPVVDLLGGVVREQVPYSAYLFFKYEGAGGELGFGTAPAATGWAAARQRAALDPAGIVAQARGMVEAFGFESIKLKAGILDPDLEVDTILALREAFGPDMPLRIDPNGAWTPETALRCGKRLEGVLEYYEDPVRGQDGMAQLRQQLAMPFATNMCTTSYNDIPGSVAAHSEDIILTDHHFWGGLRATLELSRVASTFGRGLSMHSNSHAGISLAAMTHLAAATPALTYACDTHYPWQTDDLLVGGPMAIEGGCVRVSREPGLGITLNQHALQRAHQAYLDFGLTDRDDEVEMRKVDADWTFLPVRY